MSDKTLNIPTLDREMNWFLMVLESRFRTYFEQSDLEDIPSPDLTDDLSNYAQVVKAHAFGEEERIVIMLAMVPHLRPQLLDIFFTKNTHFDRGFTEFGGYLGKFHGGFLPTGETAAFLLTLGDVQHRMQVAAYFKPDHPFAKEEILTLKATEDDEPSLSAPLVLSDNYLKYFTTGEHSTPESFAVFPAKKITTNLEWSDLVVDKEVREEIDQIQCWASKGQFLMEDMGLANKVKPGYRSLFYGPPGTGKTLTACLLGKHTGRDVYRVDLSIIVSKYIGETEKNLARIFDYAEKHDWILFFDEADALFGKRTQTSSANDRYANQETSYLLQRIEDFPGIIILASNLKSNIDEAFSRRFQSVVYFAIPNAQNRFFIWSKIFSGPLKSEEKLDLRELAREYELSGGSAINIYRYGAIKAVQRGSQCILKEDILKGIQREFQKDGKTI